MSTTRIRAIMAELPSTVDGPKLLELVLEAALLLLEPLPKEEFIELSGIFLTIIDNTRIRAYIEGLPTGNLSVKAATPLIKVAVQVERKLSIVRNKRDRAIPGR